MTLRMQAQALLGSTVGLSFGSAALSRVQTSPTKPPKNMSVHKKPRIPGESLAQGQLFWTILVPALDQLLELGRDNLLGEIRLDELPPVFADLLIKRLVGEDTHQSVRERARVVPHQDVHPGRQAEARQAGAVGDYGQAQRHCLGDFAFESTSESHWRNRHVAGLVDLANVGHETKDLHVRTRQCFDF